MLDEHEGAGGIAYAEFVMPVSRMLEAVPAIIAVMILLFMCLSLVRGPVSFPRKQKNPRKKTSVPQS
jgi:hypothetical protein